MPFSKLTIDNWTGLDHSKIGLVCYSNPHCTFTNLSKASTGDNSYESTISRKIEGDLS